MSQAMEPDEPGAGVVEVDTTGLSEPAVSPGDVFTMEEAARLKGVSYHTVSRAVRSGRLNSRRSGRMNLFSAEDLNQWHPMRDRAPKKHRQREPELISSSAVIDLASGERIELARRLTAIYEAIHASAIHQPLDEFLRLLAEQFARAMYFERVALWLINEDRTEISHSASYGVWYQPGSDPGRIAAPYDPGQMYLSRPDVYDGITCWTTPPPVNTGPAFSAPLIVGQMHLGYIIGDRDGAAFTLSEAQVQLGQSLAIQAAITIDLKRTRLREDRRTRQLEAVLEQISEPVLVYNADRRIIAMSRVARRMYGMTEDLDLAAKPFSLRDLDLGAIRFRGERASNPPSDLALAGNTVKGFEFSFVRHDTGEERLLLVDAVPIMEDGDVSTVVAVERDITDFRAIEERERVQREQLEQSLERTRAIADIPLAINAGTGLRLVLRDAVRKLTKLIGAKRGGVGLLIEGDPRNGLWTFILDTRQDEIMPLNLREFTGTLRAFEAGKPTLNTYETASEAERKIMDAAGTRSNLITPLIVDGDLAGSVYANFTEEDPVLPDDLLAFTTALAAQCALAIKQARLHRQIEAERASLQAVVAELEQLTILIANESLNGATFSPETELRLQHVLSSYGNRASSGQ